MYLWLPDPQPEPRRRGWTVGAAILVAALAPASALAAPLGVDLTAELHPGAEFSELRLTLSGAAGPAFLWALSTTPAPPPSTDWHPIAVEPLVQGNGQASQWVANSSLLGLETLYARAFFVDGGDLVPTAPVKVAAVDEEPMGDPLDFDWSVGGEPLGAGVVVSAEQPWSDFVSIRATNADPAHPDQAILFDSSNPGVDIDLTTPGVGPGNFKALGLLLVIAANDVDADGDGLVDVPDAEDAGGTLEFQFAGLSTVSGLRLVDVDEGASVRWFAGEELVGYEDVPPGSDNSVYVTGGDFGVTRMQVEFAGSAGIGEMVVYPCEAVIDFDTLSTGLPVPFEAGTKLGSGAAQLKMLGGLGLFFAGDNADPTHPDEPLLFDSGAPSGGDDDLATPGFGAGNDTALGKVLILPENDLDLNADGLVDDPDDEAAGGVLTLGWFTSSGRFRGATILDIDAHEDSWIEVVLDDGSGSVVIPLQGLGNNSAQTIEVDVGPTRRVEFHLAGSGAIAEVRICPSY